VEKEAEGASIGLIKPPDWISENPPRGGLSLQMEVPQMPFDTIRF
jgi:hypothetical protein